MNEYGEPWSCGYDGDGPDCLIGFRGILCVRVIERPDFRAVDMAIRIVACLNAMQGIPDEYVRKWADGGLLKHFMQIPLDKPPFSEIPTNVMIRGSVGSIFKAVDDAIREHK